MQNWSDKHTSDSIFKLKWSPKMVQNDAPRGPNGLQNPFWRPPERPSWKVYVFEGLEDASGTSFGRPFGRPKSFQSRYGSVSNTQLISKSVLGWFWDVLDTNFWLFLKASWAKITSKNDKSDEVKIFKNTCVFTVRLHLRHVGNVWTKRAGAFFFWLWDWCTSESMSGPPPGLDLGAIWAAKIDPKAIRRPSRWALDFGPRF